MKIKLKQILLAFVLSLSSLHALSNTQGYTGEEVATYVYNGILGAGQQFSVCASLGYYITLPFESDDAFLNYFVLGDNELSFNIALSKDKNPMIFSGTFLRKDDICIASYSLNMISSVSCKVLKTQLFKDYQLIANKEDTMDISIWYKRGSPESLFISNNDNTKCNALFSFIKKYNRVKVNSISVQKEPDLVI